MTAVERAIAARLGTGIGPKHPCIRGRTETSKFLSLLSGWHNLLFSDCRVRVADRPHFRVRLWPKADTQIARMRLSPAGSGLGLLEVVLSEYERSELDLHPKQPDEPLCESLPQDRDEDPVEAAGRVFVLPLLERREAFANDDVGVIP